MPDPHALSPLPSDRQTAEVDELLAAYNEPVAGAAMVLRSALLATDPRIEESIKWKSPSYRLDEHFATLNVRPGRPLLLVLHRGAKVRPDVPARLAVPDPSGLLEWRSNDRANVTLVDAADAESKRGPLTEIVRAWIGFL